MQSLHVNGQNVGGGGCMATATPDDSIDVAWVKWNSGPPTTVLVLLGW